MNRQQLASHALKTSPIPVDPAGLPERTHAAWLGRCIGNTMGKPVEGMDAPVIRRYLEAIGEWPQRGYVTMVDPLPEGVPFLSRDAWFSSAGTFTDVPRDDDIDWTIIGLVALEQYGDTLTTEHIAELWLDRLPYMQVHTAERLAYRNLVNGRLPEDAAEVGDESMDWIGALIRGDIFGYVNPGDPGRAAADSLVDGWLTHRGVGLHGEQWAAALVAAALAVDDARTALGAALGVIPGESELATSQLRMIELYDSGATRDDALRLVQESWGHLHWIHTIHNAALIATGLLWGEDFTDAVALTISGGWDTDSTAATVGSVFGALHGLSAIPPELIGSTHVHVRSAVMGADMIPIAELARRTDMLRERLSSERQK